ncbi:MULTISPECIES: tRNA (adenosine(37)-N6)-threonylcarbamoyltransferase complex ATPase subunit type 1 TsaE [Terrabacteria group]|uniref:tRNA (adenosine(37)-N6)-threonylcarbamoyltransferase complex ATPase subunit type 1 TsaE n=1 Tax=Bacillati TaxID=1783272 RepID=UPI001C6E9F77|nr:MULTISPECIES: tRNA (adenosine(37)-N6)-threonylcarbamoyltransferase complex ATPase subunit type 1 TsaE [Terrabacteria group]MBW9213172.1 tRNA (adenosine(37)-N6)-threonylcarbamoyltransferase complex ATPase subunit type 1 TsaE [Trueperella sp. zg.1013]
MKTYTYTSHSMKETFSLGEKIGKHAFEGFLLLLDGDLGAGKTSLTKGIGKGLEVTKTITSPTFNIQKIYKGRITLNHIDAYRLEGIVQDLGFDEYFNEEAVTVIEWSHFMSYLLPEKYLNCTITIRADDSRVYHFEANGKPYEDFLEVLK